MGSSDSPIATPLEMATSMTREAVLLARAVKRVDAAGWSKLRSWPCCFDVRIELIKSRNLHRRSQVAENRGSQSLFGLRVSKRSSHLHTNTLQSMTRLVGEHESNETFSVSFSPAVHRSHIYPCFH